MSELTKRTIKYYIKQAFKEILSFYILISAMVAIFFLYNVASGDNMFFYEEESIIWYYGWVMEGWSSKFMVILIYLFSLHTVIVYDNVLLSMGARRKDIFWGTIVKQNIYFAFCVPVIYIFRCMCIGEISGVSVGEDYYIMCMLSGALGVFMGYQLKIYGRSLLLILAFSVIFTICIVVSLAIIFSELITCYYYKREIIVVVVFIALEVIIYNLNKMSRVNA